MAKNEVFLKGTGTRFMIREDLNVTKIFPFLKVWLPDAKLSLGESVCCQVIKNMDKVQKGFYRILNHGFAWESKSIEK